MSRPRGRKKPSTAQVPALVRNLRIQTHGRKYSPKCTPSLVCDSPWNHIVVSDFQQISAITEPDILNPYAIYISLINQIGLTSAAPPVEFRLQKVEVWAMDSTPVGFIMDVYPLQTLATGGFPIERCESLPGKNQWACAGYQWPASHQNYVFQIPGSEPSTNPTILRIYTSAPNADFWIRYHLLWRVSVSTYPQLLDRFQKLMLKNSS